MIELRLERETDGRSNSFLDRNKLGRMRALCQKQSLLLSELYL
ncbi:hypothetical protein PUND_b0443 [Pseudoalteromonas undina]|nr:hypothetical protein PUND_b0443 [Pseudoalteromonas undina]